MIKLLMFVILLVSMTLYDIPPTKTKRDLWPLVRVPGGLTNSRNRNLKAGVKSAEGWGLTSFLRLRSVLTGYEWIISFTPHTGTLVNEPDMTLIRGTDSAPFIREEERTLTWYNLSGNLTQDEWRRGKLPHCGRKSFTKGKVTHSLPLKASLTHHGLPVKGEAGGCGEVRISSTWETICSKSKSLDTSWRTFDTVKKIHSDCFNSFIRPLQ